MFINQGHFTKKYTCLEPGNRKLTRPPSHSPLGQHDSCPCRQSACFRAAGISPLPHHCPEVTPSLVPTDRRYLSSATGSSPLNPENVLCLLIPLLFLASLSVSFPSLLHLPCTPQSPEIQLSPFLYTEPTLAKITALTSPNPRDMVSSPLAPCAALDGLGCCVLLEILCSPPHSLPSSLLLTQASILGPRWRKTHHDPPAGKSKQRVPRDSTRV